MKDLKQFIKTTIREFLNEQNNNYITLYHGGYIDKLHSSIYLTEDYYMAKSYDNNVYTFLLDKKHWVGHYHAGSIKDANIHIMNKFALDRFIDEDLVNE